MPQKIHEIRMIILHFLFILTNIIFLHSIMYNIAFAGEIVESKEHPYDSSHLNSSINLDLSELMKNRQAEAINATLADAFKKDPETEAKSNRIAAESGVPALNLLSPNIEDHVQRILFESNDNNIYDPVDKRFYDVRFINDPDVLELIKNRQAEAINGALADAFEKDPEVESKNNRIAAESGVPAVDLLSAEYQDWYKKTFIEKTNARELVKPHPMTARALSNERFAGVAHDDIDNIKAFEDELAKIGKPRETFWDTLPEFLKIMIVAGCVGGIARGAVLMLEPIQKYKTKIKDWYLKIWRDYSNSLQELETKKSKLEKFLTIFLRDIYVIKSCYGIFGIFYACIFMMVTNESFLYSENLVTLPFILLAIIAYTILQWALPFNWNNFNSRRSIFLTIIMFCGTSFFLMGMDSNSRNLWNVVIIANFPLILLWAWIILFHTKKQTS